MPLKYWDHTFITATHLINCIPTKVLDYDTPLHRLLGATPDYSTLRVFGYACWPNLRPYNNRKLQFCSIRYAFLGYSNLHKGYKYLGIASGGIYISRDVVCIELAFRFAQLYPNVGSRYTSEVLLLLDPTQVANPDSSVHNTPANIVFPMNLLPSPCLQPHKIPETTCAAPDAANPDGDAPLGFGAFAPTSGDDSHPDSGHNGPCVNVHATSSPAPAPVPANRQASAPALLPTTIEAATTESTPDDAPAVQSMPASSSTTAPPHAPSTSAPCTRLQAGIRNPKLYIQYSPLCQFSIC
jgi:hypothetical protein